MSMRKLRYMADSERIGATGFNTDGLMVLGFAGYEAQAKRLSRKMGVSYMDVVVHRFPDGESKVTLPPRLPPHVIFCNSLSRPNDKLIELLLAAQTARNLGATRLTLVVPYLCYMRQDTAFQPGEAVSQLIIGRMLTDLFDRVITMDPHLHRIDSIEAAIPDIEAIALTASDSIGKFLAAKLPDALIVGPDAESEQWARTIACSGGMDFAIGRKVRTGDCSVEIELPLSDMRRRHVVLVDDIVSTGETMAVAARLCLSAGAKKVDVFVCHALFADGALHRMRYAGIADIESTDSITHSTNILHLDGLLADAVLSEWKVAIPSSKIAAAG